MFPHNRIALLLLLALGVAGCARTEPRSPRPTVVDLQIDPAAPTLAVGDTIKVTAQALYSDGSLAALDAAIWSVDDATLLTLAPTKGLVSITGVKVGTTRLVVSSLGLSQSVQVKVTAPTALKLALTPSQATINVGGVATFTATLTLSDQSTSVVTQQADWSISDQAVASAGAGSSKGSFTGLKAGSAVVTVGYQGLTATAPLTVNGAALVRIDVTPSKMLVPLKTSLPLKAVAVFDDSTVSDVTDQATWSSSSTAIATVSTDASPRGLVTAVAAGDVTITASYGTKSGTAAITVTTAQVLSVELDPPLLQLAKGTSGSFTATAIFSGDVPPQDVTLVSLWASSDPKIASMSTTALGTVKGESAGQTKVTATFLGLSGSAPVTVTPATLTGITVNPAKQTVPKGSLATFTAQGTYSDGTSQDVTLQALWKSSDETVATVSNAPGTKGQALAKSPGSASITATLDAVSGSADLEVTAAEVVSLVIEPDFAVIAKGTTGQLRAKATMTDLSTLDATDQSSWSSSDNATASVTTTATGRGVVSGAKPGQVTITAAFGGKTATATVVVSPATLLSITLSPLDPSIAKGTKLQMKATGTYSDGNIQDVTTLAVWSVTDSSIASVSNAAGSQGLVSAISPGKTTLKASLAGQSAQTSLTVTAATLTKLQVAPPKVVIDYKGTQQLIATATYSDGTSADVTTSTDWSSADPTIASVTSGGTARGLVTGNRAGQTVVTASFGGLSVTVPVTVNAPKLTSLEIRPSSLSLPAGKTGKLAAWATYADGSQADVTTQSAWSDYPSGVISVDQNGAVTALAAGSATVTALFQGMSATAKVDVTGAEVDKLVIAPTNTTIAQNRTQEYTVTAWFSDGTNQDVTKIAQFTTDDTQGIISLAGSVATGVKQGGPVTITATYKGLQASAKLTVGPPVTIKSLTVSPGTKSIPVGGQVTLTATVLYSDNSTEDVTSKALFTSADRNTVDMNANLAVGVAVGGPVTVTATYGGATGTAQITVTTASLSSIEIQPAGAVLQKGGTVQLAAIGHYSDGSTKDITSLCSWNTSDYTICSVSVGNVTGVGAGTATVTASYSGLKGTASITVQVATLQHIAIAPPNAVLRPNLIYPFRAFAVYSDQTVVEVPHDVNAWSIDNASVAQMILYNNYFGLWAVGVGTTPVYVNYDSKMGNTRVQVLNSDITGVEVSPAKLILPNGTAAKLAGVFAYKSAGDGWAVEIQNPDWSSDNAAIAKIDANGVGTAVAPGNTTIRVTTNDAFGNQYTAYTDVTVTTATIKSIQLDVPAKMVVGLAAKVHALGTFSDGSVMDLGPSPVFWSVSDSSLASILPDVDGATVTAQKAGNVTVGAALGPASASVPVQLVSTSLSSLSFSVDQSALAQGSTAHPVVTGSFADGTVLDLSTSATYESLAPDVAQVMFGLYTNMPWPLVIAHAPDKPPATARLRASFQGLSKTTDVTVSGANLRSLAVAVGSNPPSPTVTLSSTGGPYQLRAVGTFTDNSTADVTAFCTFEPASPGTGIVATISNSIAGKVTLLGKGSEQLKVTYAPSYIGQPLITNSATLVVQ